MPSVKLPDGSAMELAEGATVKDLAELECGRGAGLNAGAAAQGRGISTVNSVARNLPVNPLAQQRPPSSVRARRRADPGAVSGRS